ncbi:MAG TPA: hypothetical protein VFA90_15450 [Terriglobales bacterium]|nr:hypothetical protein [Terriglobales bacterium]
MRLRVAIALLLAAPFAHAVNPPRPVARPVPVTRPTPPITLKPVLYPILGNSQRIFAGTVLQVLHLNPSPASTLASTSIRFRVDEAIRGVRQGQIVEIREWAGLWQSGERYRPGERVLLFLYPPSKLGLTSPVGHRAGRFPLDKNGRVLLRQTGSLPRPVELRRVVAAIRGAEQE